MPIIYSIRESEIKTTRERFNQAEKRYDEDPGAALRNKPGVRMPEKVADPGLRPHNPMELY